MALNKDNMPEEPVSDVVDVRAQPHYAKHAIQPIEFMQSVLTKEAFLGYLRANAIKYLTRAPDKNGVQDYEKAQVYIGWIIQVERGEIIKGLR